MTATKAIIDRYYRLLKERNRRGLLALLSPEIKVIYHAQNSRLPWAGQFDRIEGFDRFFEIIKSRLDIVEVVIHDRLYDKNKAVMQCQGTWLLKANQTRIKGSMVNIFTVENDQITTYEVYADTAAFESALCGAPSDG